MNDAVHDSAQAVSELLELIAVAVQLKPAARILRSKNCVPSLRAQAKRLQLVLVESGLVVEDTVPIVGGAFSVTSLKCPSSTDLVINYVARRDSIRKAEQLAELECGAGDDEAIGVALGYPRCCAAAYRTLLRDGNWVKRLLAPSLPGIPAYAACNRFARLFGAQGILPDYFPCSLRCEASRELGSRLDEVGRAYGLAAYLDSEWRELLRPIRFADCELIQLGIPLRSVAIDEGSIPSTVITWVK